MVSSVARSYLESLCKRNSALLKKEKCQQHLCTLLLCAPHQAEKRAQEHLASRRVSPKIRDAYNSWKASEAGLEQASQELAEAELDKMRAQLDADIKHIDC